MSFILRVILFGAALAAAMAQTAPPIRVLFLGNSLTDGNNVPELVKQMAALQGVALEYDMRAPGGHALEDHWADGTQRLLQQQRYHAVVLQQGPSTLPESQTNLRQWVGTWAGEARRYLAEPTVYMVWPVRTQANGFALVSQSYRNAAQSANARIFPAGEAWQEVMRLDPSIALYTADDLHATPAGSFLAAMVITRGLVGLDPSRVTTRVSNVIIPETTLQRFQSVVATLPAGSPPGAASAPAGSPTAADLAATYAFTTLAGSASLGSADGTAADARFASPAAIAVSANGDVFVADTDNDTVRRISASGQVTTLAGSAGRPGVTDGTGAAARLSAPPSIALDPTGNLFVADNSNAVIRKISPTGVVTTHAGQAGARGGTDGTAAGARFQAPIGVAVDGGGNLYVADAGAHTIRKIAADGNVTTIAGLAGAAGSSDGAGTAARFNSPRALAVDGAGFVYVADRANHTIRTISPSGIVTTVAGSAGTAGSSDGVGSAARFFAPQGIAVDASGALFVADTGNHVIRRIAPGGNVTTLAGSAQQAGSADGRGAAARFIMPEGVAIGVGGALLVADTMNNTIRRVAADGDVTTIAGLAQGSSAGSGNGTGSAARFNVPTGIALTSSGEVLVADRGNYTVRRISPFGMVSTIAGVTGQQGSITGDLNLYSGPIDVAVDNAGNLFVADANRTIRKISPNGTASGFVGNSASAGSADGLGGAARFVEIGGLAFDNSGNLYATDRETLRRITPAGDVTTVAGLFGSATTVDGQGAGARFGRLLGIAIDAAGNIFVADTAEHTIRKVTPAFQVTTFAGLPNTPGSTDGNGIAARFRNPSGVAVDGTGIVFVADTGNELIRRIVPSGDVTTIGGLSGAYGSTDGTASDARFSGPRDIAVDGAGNLYISNVSPDSNTIRKGSRVAASVTPVPATPITPTTPTTPSTPAGGGGGVASWGALLAWVVVWMVRRGRTRK